MLNYSNSAANFPTQDVEDNNMSLSYEETHKNLGAVFFDNFYKDSKGEKQSPANTHFKDLKYEDLQFIPGILSKIQQN